MFNFCLTSSITLHLFCGKKENTLPKSTYSKFFLLCNKHETQITDVYKQKIRISVRTTLFSTNKI